MTGLRYTDFLATGERASANSQFGPRSAEDRLPADMSQGQGQKVFTMALERITDYDIVLNNDDGSILELPSGTYIDRALITITDSFVEGPLQTNYAFGYASIDGVDTVTAAFASQDLGNRPAGTYYEGTGPSVGDSVITTNGVPFQVTVTNTLDFDPAPDSGRFYFELYYRTPDDRAQNRTMTT